MSRKANAPMFPGDGVIKWVDRDFPDPGNGELLIAVRANAICGTDRSVYFGGGTHVAGHEAAGVVIATGPATTTPPGARGVVFLMDFCGSCRSCLIGATNQCLRKRGDMGFTSDGGYGPYEVLHESQFFPVTDDVPLDAATMLLDVMGTSNHAIGRAELVRGDIESVYIAGAGPVGIGIAVMAGIRYGSDVPIYISDVSPWRREFAGSFGAIPVDASVPSAIAGIGQVDVAFDASGKEVARRAALDILSKRGVLVCVGHGETVTLNVVDDLLTPEHSVLGSEYFRFDELPGNLALIRTHQELISRVITHRFPVSELDAAFAAFLSGDTGKVVVTRDDQE